MIRFAIFLAIGSLVTGCYSLHPVMGGAPEVGTKVAFDVSDAGRVELGGSMGPEIGQIEGVLLGKQNGAYQVAVSGVRFLRGGEQTWTGERVTIKQEHVSRAYERRFSKGRTIALGATIVGTVALVALTSDLLGFGREPTDGEPPEPPIEFIPRRP